MNFLKTPILIISAFSLISISCKSTNTDSASTTKDITDIQSMQIAQNGLNYNVICKDGTYEIVTPNNLKQGKVCESGGGSISEPEPTNCQTFNPDDESITPKLFNVVNNPGYTNHKTLKWPNGEVFRLMNKGYANHKTLKWPNEEIMVRNNKGYTDHNMSYWPNGNKFMKFNKGYTDHGSIYRPDNSVWLKRNGAVLNMNGLPIHSEKFEKINVKAKVEGKNGILKAILKDQQLWSIRININSNPDQLTSKVSVTECINF